MEMVSTANYKILYPDMIPVKIPVRVQIKKWFSHQVKQPIKLCLECNCPNSTNNNL